MVREKTYFPTLDGWRAAAVIGVILYHGREGFFRPDSLALRLSAHGDVGVSAFFAISGFLITSLLLREFAQTGDLNLRSFYIRRVFRILPPYFLVLAVLCILPVFGVIHLNLSEVPGCLFFYRNYLPLGMDQRGGYYTAHFWSLAVEEHFYLLWPMLLVAVRPKRAGKAALLLTVGVVGWRTLEPHLHFLAGILPPDRLLARTDTRIDGLLWGCLAAIYLPQLKRLVDRVRFSQLWMVFLAALPVVEVLHVPELTAVRSVLLSALVVSTVLQPQSLLGRVLEWQPLRWIGAVSYSLYLWQQLFLPEVRSEMAHGPLLVLQHWPWNVLAMVGCACLSRYLLEIPMTRWGHELARARTPGGPPPIMFPRPAQAFGAAHAQTGTHGRAPVRLLHMFEVLPRKPEL